jgi:O-antigen/teichoic acid export membrane protein
MKTKIIYAVSRYAAYGLKFIQALLIAKYLGPNGLAIFGFAQLIALYFSFMHLGIPLSIHTQLSVAKEQEIQQVDSYISDALWFLILSGIAFCAVSGLITFAFPSLFHKFQFRQYGVLAVAMGVNMYIVQFFANIYQYYGQFLRVALNELVTIIILFAIIVIFRNSENDLLFYFLLVNALTLIVNLVFFLYQAPFKIQVRIRLEVIQTLVRIGLPMLLSSVGFYLITISVRSIASYAYDLRAIGLLTFGVGIANALMLGLNAMSWTFYSTILANTSGTIESAYKYTKQVNLIYNTLVSLTIFLGICFLPLLFIFMPEYESFYKGLAILFLAQLFTSVSFGSVCLLLAQNKQNALAVISFISLIIVVVLSTVVALLKLPFVYQTVAILAGMYIYSVLIGYRAARVLNMKAIPFIFSEITSIKILIPVIVWLVILMFDAPYAWLIVPFSLSVVMLLGDLKLIYQFAKAGKKAT